MAEEQDDASVPTKAAEPSELARRLLGRAWAPVGLIDVARSRERLERADAWARRHVSFLDRHLSRLQTQFDGGDESTLVLVASPAGPPPAEGDWPPVHDPDRFPAWSRELASRREPALAVTPAGADSGHEGRSSAAEPGVPRGPERARDSVPEPSAPTPAPTPAPIPAPVPRAAPVTPAISGTTATIQRKPAAGAEGLPPMPLRTILGVSVPPALARPADLPLVRLAPPAGPVLVHVPPPPPPVLGERDAALVRETDTRPETARSSDTSPTHASNVVALPTEVDPGGEVRSLEQELALPLPPSDVRPAEARALPPAASESLSDAFAFVARVNPKAAARPESVDAPPPDPLILVRGSASAPAGPFRSDARPGRESRVEGPARPELVWRRQEAGRAASGLPSGHASGGPRALPFGGAGHPHAAPSGAATRDVDAQPLGTPFPPASSSAPTFTAGVETSSARDGGIDVARLAEQVTRMILRDLAIERERRGGFRWP